MKKEYDLKKLEKRSGRVKSSGDFAKLPISIRLDGSVLAALKTEAGRLGIPYQTYVGSILYRYVHGELVDEKSANLVKLLKKAS